VSDADAVRGARLLELVAVMDRLRSPGGCPWDAAQTHESLTTYLLEEAYETVEAIETGDDPALREELGDLLLQVVFHARIAEEHPQPWDVDDVAGGIVDKLVARHPHVFGDATADSPAQVEEAWDALKRREKGRTSAVEGVPLGQPALALAEKLLGRVERAGLDVPVAAPALPQEALASALTGEAALGDLLLGLAHAARAAGLDAERALRGAARAYVARVHEVESRL